ncbi:glycerophosphodiester phosphodiesterase [Nocardioides sp. TRM66260-LWL]|uniref:glycerophosphodiester phosphodiesterase family protein n=1 Tax=Nocardioides sp. TRM66260-LWL TaxID=2874478 RepID=UPI001CC346BE|nr:glycerophosphodiester phosphodiesterase family protein [Nocardioides sp. TRM66260-LWL]MBZ5733225.1 glycerophosphodiester phosphodiesterase [Nocardioides sp. TRM66260-LWL]
MTVQPRSAVQPAPSAALAPPPLPRTGTTLVAAHRGASGHRPEHTLEAFRTALAMGADELELDLVATADGVLVVRHESDLRKTTDLADRPELAGRWRVEDLALAEVRRLRARERRPALRPGSAALDGRLGVATLGDVLDLVDEHVARGGARPGVLLEVKEPARSARRGLPLADLLVGELTGRGVEHASSGVSIMAFDPVFLRALAPRVGLPLVQLVDRHDPFELTTDEGLLEVQRYASGIGVHHRLLAGDGATLPTRAHERWLSVRTWTLRAESTFLPKAYRRRAHPDRNPLAHGDLAGYAAHLAGLGVDGLITDHPDVVGPAVR